MKTILLLFTLSIIAYNGQAQNITTVAGSGYDAGTSNGGYSGDGGPATAAELYLPLGVAVDSSGNLYIADGYNYVVRKVTAATGIITTIAGNDTAGYSGDGGPATAAEMGMAAGIALDDSGNIYVGENFTNVVRKITAATGIITTIAGNDTSGYSGDGGPAAAAELRSPTGLAVDHSGNVYIADYANNVIRKVTAATGIITTVAGNGYGAGEGYMNGIYSSDGEQATASELYLPSGVALDDSGNIYIVEEFNNLVRKVIAATGILTTVAGDHSLGINGYGYSGDGGPATAAQLASPSGIALDDSNNMYISDAENNVIRKVTATGIITTIAGNNTPGYSGDGGLATAAELHLPLGMAIDDTGNVYVADQVNNAIRKVTSGRKNLAVANIASSKLYVSLSPNPAANSTMVTYSGADKNVIVYVTDVMGKTVFAITANGQSGNISLPLQSLSSGYYMVMLQSGERQVVNKLIKE